MRLVCSSFFGKSSCTAPATYCFLFRIFAVILIHFFIVLVIGSTFGILPFLGDASLATASIVLDFNPCFNEILRAWKSVGITTRFA
jgi:hypothetical protein